MAILLALALAVSVPLLERADEVETSHFTPPHPLADERDVPPEPRLQVTPSQDLMQHEAEVKKQLTTYGWVDKKTGRVHVPIERAMELVLPEIEVRK
jgi:hypothetical protein